MDEYLLISVVVSEIGNKSLIYIVKNN